MNLTELDALMAGMEMPVRPGTLEEAWDVTEVGDRVRHVVLLVTMHARPGLEASLERASRAFVATTGGLAGSLGSTLHQSPDDPRTWFLLERFATEESFARHMASDYFADYKAVQAALLVEPVTATFVERGT